MSTINNSDDETDDPFSYLVQYQYKGDTDWCVMTCRDHGEPFRSEIPRSMHEISSMDEAVEIAEALKSGISHPDPRPDRSRRPIVASRVFTIVRLAKVTAVYGTPTADVPRETSTTEETP